MSNALNVESLVTPAEIANDETQCIQLGKAGDDGVQGVRHLGNGQLLMWGKEGPEFGGQSEQLFIHLLDIAVVQGAHPAPGFLDQLYLLKGHVDVSFPCDVMKIIIHLLNRAPGSAPFGEKKRGPARRHGW
ncbi:hypothetical protein [Aeromonas caviae]|uniref:hypothetical protein n=1 Tax=Aeromonas caviae TaxID=648 RepID=UPI002F400D98